MRSLLLTILLTACTTSTKTEDGDGSPVQDDGTDLSCALDSDCAAYEICETEVCVTGDRSNSFSEAEDIAVSTSDEDNSVTGHINTAGDKDYWRYVSTGGEFIQASIDRHDIAEDHPEDEPKPDLFITLYDPDGIVVTSADNYANGGSVSDADSVIYAYLSRAGDYVIVVEDVYARNGEEGLSGPEYNYRLEVSRRVGTDGLESSIEEPIRLDGSGSTGIQMTSTSWRTVGVLIDEPGEVDYIAVLFDNDNLDPLIDKDPDGNPYTWTDGLLKVAGVEDLETGSDATPMVTLLSPEDVEVAHSEDVGPTNTMKYPAITSGQWIIAATDANGGGGPNHWFYLLLNADNKGDNIPWEVEENGMASVATPIPTTDTTNPRGKAFSQGAIQGFVNEAGDNDWFSMSAPADNAGDIDGEPAQWVVVCANSHLWGAASSPRITVYDASGSVLGEAETDPDGNPNVEIKNLVIEPGETINVQVNHGAESIGAADEWYRMKVFIASFEVGSYTCP